MRASLGLAALLTFALLAGCTEAEGEPLGPTPQATPPPAGGAPTVSTAPTPGGGGAPPPGAFTVSIVDDAFEPATLAVPPGSKVTWRHDGGRPHSITFAALPVDEIVRPSESRSVTFPEPGEYAYRCIFHPGMDGTILVGDATTGTNSTPPPAEPVPVDPAPPQEPPADASGVRANVTVLDDVFQPSAVRIPAGASVAWTNQGGGHSVTIPSLGVDHVMQGGETFLHAFDTPGTYPYHCAFHDDMRGTVEVVEPSAYTPPEPGIDPSLPQEATIVLDGGHYDERPVQVAAGGRVTWQNPAAGPVVIEFEQGAGPLEVPAGGGASREFPAGEYLWRVQGGGEEWRLDDHDVGVVRAG